MAQDEQEALVGLVVVSHSADVAEGTVRMAREMAGEEVALVAAGGGPDRSLGSDAEKIARAIGEADAGAGVVVMADLGSAILATKAALELVAPETAARTRLSRGPLVEGAVVAAVQASIGNSLAEVLEAADTGIEKDVE